MNEAQYRAFEHAFARRYTSADIALLAERASLRVTGRHWSRLADSDHDRHRHRHRHRRGQAQRPGAGDYQHGEGTDQSKAPTRFGPEEAPG